MSVGDGERVHTMVLSSVISLVPNARDVVSVRERLPAGTTRTAGR